MISNRVLLSPSPRCQRHWVYGMLLVDEYSRLETLQPHPHGLSVVEGGTSKNMPISHITESAHRILPILSRVDCTFILLQRCSDSGIVPITKISHTSVLSGKYHRSGINL